MGRTSVAESAVPIYRPDIDGLRALAVTSVCLFHAGISVISGGFAGVDVFFVISGYLIGGIIYREIVADTFSFAKFYARRAKRILPALFTLLGVTSVVAFLMLAPSELMHFAKSALSSIFAVSNISFWLGTNYFSPAAELNPLLMTWTLGVEEQFYLLVPALMLVIYRFAPRQLFSSIASVSVVSFLVCLWATARYPAASFYLLPTRAWELAIGVLLAMYESRYSGKGIARRLGIENVLSVVAVCLLLFAFCGLNSSTPFPGLAALIPVLGSALLIATSGSFINVRLLSWAPVVFIGRISYSWYLWHWPLLSFARIATDGQLAIGKAICVLAISFCAAVVSWKYIEERFRRSRFSARSTLRGYAIATAIMVVVVGALSINRGLPQRFSPELRTLETSRLGLSDDSCLANYGVSTPNLTSSCVSADRGRPSIALLGDSHAAALAGALRLEAIDSGHGFLQLTKASCPPLLGLTRRMPNHPQHERECSQFTSRALTYVMNQPSIKAVVLAGYWSAPFVEESSGSRFVQTDQLGVYVSPAESRTNLRIGLSRTIKALQAAHKHVIVALDVPMYRFDPLIHVETLYIPARKFVRGLLATDSGIGDWSAPQSDLLDWNDPSAQIPRIVSAQFPDVKVVDLANAFCARGECSFADRSGAFYIDDQHLSFIGAQRATRLLNVSKEM
jgi:peptidoglycan/LPS O-acetylase OafA/YrhL